MVRHTWDWGPGPLLRALRVLLLQPIFLGGYQQVNCLLSFCRVNHLGAWSVSRSLPISNFKKGFPPRWCESDGIFELELNPPPSHLPQMLCFSQANSRMLQFSSVGKDVDTYYVKHRMSGFHSFYLFSQFSLGRQAGQSGSRQSGIPQ